MMEMQELDGIDDEKAELSGKVFSIEKQKRFLEFQKDAKKYVIFVVALPLIGVIGLVIYSALSYEYVMNSNHMEILPNSAEGRINTNIILCSSNPCSENAECEDQEKGFFCRSARCFIAKIAPGPARYQKVRLARRLRSVVLDQPGQSPRLVDQPGDYHIW